MEIQVRQADGYDIEQMAKLVAGRLRGGKRRTPDKKAIAKGLAMMTGSGEERAAFIALARESIVGLVTAQLLISTSEGSLVAVADDLTVMGDNPGDEVGSLLMKAVHDWGRGLGAQKSYLVRPRADERELPDIARSGWKPTGCELWLHSR